MFEREFIMEKCPKYSWGNPRCHIVNYPDCTDKFFCTVCQEKFQKYTSEKDGKTKNKDTDEDSQPFLFLLFILFLLVVGIATISTQEKSSNPSSILPNHTAPVSQS